MTSKHIASTPLHDLPQIYVVLIFLLISSITLKGEQHWATIKAQPYLKPVFTWNSIDVPQADSTNTLSSVFAYNASSIHITCLYYGDLIHLGVAIVIFLGRVSKAFSKSTTPKHVSVPLQPLID